MKQFKIVFVVFFSFLLIGLPAFSGGGNKPEKPGREPSAQQESEKLRKPGRDDAGDGESEKLVKPGREEETDGEPEEEKLAKPGVETARTDREKLQKPRKEEFQKSATGVKKEVEATGEGLEIIDLEFFDIFPVFYKYYDENQVGIATIRNWENHPAEDIEVYLFVKQYMDIPKQCTGPETLEDGEEDRINLHALFTKEVLTITEGTKTAAEITVEYTYKNEKYVKTYQETIRLFDRNAITWDDDRKAASFVTAKDPVVLKFSKNVAGMIRGKGSRAVNKNLLLGIALHEAISIYGLTYVVDPTTPYADLSQSDTAVDYLQFPSQTLEYKAGDCDDLSILHSGLLESLGVETAFITIPGHILMAFSVDMHPDEAKKAFSRPEDLIFMEDNTWIPVEATQIDGGFLKAWQAGAKSWREASSRDMAGFYPMHDSWNLYEPVGISSETGSIVMPPEDTVVSAYLEEVIRFIDREIYPQVAALNEEIERSGENQKSVNKLGVLYARYGLYEKAEKEFTRSLEKKADYMPALMNLGNLHYLKEDVRSALTYYEKAYGLAPDNPKVLLCVARANHDMENYGIVKKYYGKLQSLNPELARQFAYLDMRADDTMRAADAKRMREVMVWHD